MKAFYPSLYFNVGWWGMFFVWQFEETPAKILTAAITVIIFNILLYTEQDK